MNGFCAPASITQVIEAQSGITIHDYSVIQQEANHLGMSLDGNGNGISIVQAQELLSGFGISSHLYAAPTPSDAMSQLENFLAAAATSCCRSTQARSGELATTASPITRLSSRPSTRGPRR